jgi:hypothetical protein
MYFLPDDDVKIAWVRNHKSYCREGHSWYDSHYCYFELDRSQCDSESDACPIYLLYSMKGETLVNELARRKASELGIGRTCSVDADFERLIDGESKKRIDDLQFIGRFISMRPVEISSRDDNVGRIKSTWTRLTSMAAPWRFGFGRRNLGANRDRLRSAIDFPTPSEELENQRSTARKPSVIG